MPELPDLVVYLDALSRRIEGGTLDRLRVASPFVLRSVDPPLNAVESKRVVALERLGKRLVMALDDDLFVVLHLMIAGRLRWREPQAKIPGKIGLAAFDFPSGVLILTEAGTKKRASLHLVRGRAGLETFSRGGLEVLETDSARFVQRITAENRTLKRALTDPRILSGVGNAYSDEILHRARLSPVKRTHSLAPDEVGRLYDATRACLTEWIERLREQTGEKFPEKVTAFRPEMAVHGKYRQPCPVCQSPIQRIRYVSNETNYCARCQTGGKLLADRALSRLLREDWPKTIDELE